MVQNFIKIKRNKFFHHRSTKINFRLVSGVDNFEFWEPRNLRTFSVCDDHVAISF